MATNISATTLAQLVDGATVVHNRIESAIDATGYQVDADAYSEELGASTPSTDGKRIAHQAMSRHRRALASIQQDGRQMLLPILTQMGVEAGSRVVQGSQILNMSRLFRDVSADLLGGTPDYVADRAVTFAADPTPAATGVYSRLTVDHLGEKIEDGFHNQDKIIRIARKDGIGRVVANIEGQPREYADALAYRGGRLAITPLNLMGDVTGVNSAALNPFFIPEEIVNDADVTAIPQWGVDFNGTTPDFKIDTTTLWRSLNSSLKFTGANASEVTLTQNLRSILTRSPYRPWQQAVPVWLDAGWVGEIVLEMGGKNQMFSESDLSAGAWTLLKFTLDENNYALNFDGSAPQLSVNLLNGQLNTNHIYVAGVMPQPMVPHEGVWYSGYNFTSDPGIEDTIAISDSSTFVGVVQDVLSFLFHSNAPGWAHLPSSGATTIDP